MFFDRINFSKNKLLALIRIIKKTKKKMKKKIFTALCVLLLTNYSNAKIVNTTVNKIVDSVTMSYQLDVTNDGAYDITFNYFPVVFFLKIYFKYY